MMSWRSMYSATSSSVHVAMGFSFTRPRRSRDTIGAAARVVASLYDAFDRDKEPTDLDIARVLTEFVPLSKTMAEQINTLRNWATGRARFATSPAATERRLRKLAA